MNELLEKTRANLEKERTKFQTEQPESLSLPNWDEVSAGRFLKKRPPDPEYVFKDILRKGLVGAIFGQGGVSKSYFLLRVMGICLATGRPFGPFIPSRKFKVLYIGGEDPEDELCRRIYAMAEDLKLLDSSDISDNLAIYSGVGKIDPLVILDTHGDH